MGRKKIIALIMSLLLSGCVSSKAIVKVADTPKNIVPQQVTLSSILREYFQEDNIHIYEEKSKDNVNIRKLWQDLGIKNEDIAWENDDGKEKFLFDLFEDGTTSVYYRTYESHIATAINDEFES